MWRWGWEDVKRRRYEEAKMWRWEDVKMRRCEEEKMWGWEDVKMRRCEDEKMWRGEYVWQTPTIGRTLRSDALGNIYKNDLIANLQPIRKHRIQYSSGPLWPSHSSWKHDPDISFFRSQSSAQPITSQSWEQGARSWQWYLSLGNFKNVSGRKQQYNNRTSILLHRPGQAGGGSFPKINDL